MLDMRAVEALAKKKLSKVPVFGLEHVERVRGNANTISQGLDCNSLVLDAAAVLHTIGAGQWLQYRQDYVRTSLAFAKAFLERNAVEPGLSENILHCIAEHPLRGSPRTDEAMALHDAYALEVCGIRGFANLCYAAGHEKKSLAELPAMVQQHASSLGAAFTTESGKRMSAEGVKQFRDLADALEKGFNSLY